MLLLIPESEYTSVRVAASDEMVKSLVASGSFTLAEAVRADLVLPEIGDLITLKM